MKVDKQILAFGFKKKKIFKKILANVDETYFTEPWSRIFKLCKDYWEKYHKKPSLKIVSKLNKRNKINKEERERTSLGIESIRKISVNSEEFDFFLDELKKERTKSRLVSALTSVSEKVELEPEKSLLKLREELDKIIPQSISVQSKDYLSSFRERIRKSQLNKGLKLVPTFFPTFDKTFGGIAKEELGVIAAGTGKGKSIMLLNLAYNLLIHGFKVLFITIESPLQQVAFKLDSRITGIEYKKFRLGLLKESEKNLVEKRIQEIRMRGGELIILDLPPSVSFELLKEKIKLELLKKKFDAVFLDYLNIISSPFQERRVSPFDWKSQGEIVRSLKELTREFKIPLWTAALLKAKSLRDFSGEIDDIGMSYLISSGSDFVLSLRLSLEDMAKGRGWLYCGKGRDGYFPAFELLIDYNRIRIQEKLSKAK